MMRALKFALLCATGIAGSAHAGTNSWTISETSPGVFVSHAGLNKAALRGGHAEVGDIVSTGANARAVLVRGEQYAVVAPNSRLQITNPAASSGLMQIMQQWGNSVFSVRKSGTPHFGVSTPYLAAVVKGTTFSVTVDSTGASVQVLEGAVEVATNDGGARDLVLPGSIAVVGADNRGRLTIEGRTPKVIQSPNTPAVVPHAPVAAASVAQHVDFSVDEVTPSLTAISDGLVSGSAATALAAATAPTSPADRSVQAAARPVVLAVSNPPTIVPTPVSGDTDPLPPGPSNSPANPAPEDSVASVVATPPTPAPVTSTAPTPVVAAVVATAPTPAVLPSGPAVSGTGITVTIGTGTGNGIGVSSGPGSGLTIVLAGDGNGNGLLGGGHGHGEGHGDDGDDNGGGKGKGKGGKGKGGA